MQPAFPILDLDAAPPADHDLTGIEWERFRRDGFLSRPGLMPADEVAWVRATLERLFDTRAGYAEGARFDFLSAADDPDRPGWRQIVRPWVLAPARRRGGGAGGADAIARALLGEDARLSFDHVLMKPAHDGVPTPWHQDDAFADPAFESRSVSIWIPLQPVDAVNGCLAFVPGAADRDVLPHRSPNNDGRVHGLECTDGFAPADAVACPIPAGGCTVHGGRTLHGAGPNRSDAPRYAFVLVFSTPKRPAAVIRPRPWLDDKRTARSGRERSWMRRGGLLRLAWRRLAATRPRDYPRLLPGLSRRLLRRMGGR